MKTVSIVIILAAVTGAVAFLVLPAIANRSGRQAGSGFVQGLAGPLLGNLVR